MPPHRISWHCGKGFITAFREIKYTENIIEQFNENNLLKLKYSQSFGQSVFFKFFKGVRWIYDISISTILVLTGWSWGDTCAEDILDQCRANNIMILKAKLSCITPNPSYLFYPVWVPLSPALADVHLCGIDTAWLWEAAGDRACFWVR